MGSRGKAKPAVADTSVAQWWEHDSSMYATMAA